MSFLDKILRRKTNVTQNSVTEDSVTKIAAAFADKSARDARGFDFAEHYKTLRQYRLDARIRSEVDSDRRWAYSSRPRMPQAAAKVVGVVRGMLMLETGQVFGRTVKRHYLSPDYRFEYADVQKRVTNPVLVDKLAKAKPSA